MGRKPSTKYKPIQEKDLPKLVRNAVEYVLNTEGPVETHRTLQVPWKSVIVWEGKPSIDNPHKTKITFYGYTNFEPAYARYEGKFGIWEVRLTSWNGRFEDPKERAKNYPCNQTYALPWLIEASDEWRETLEQRRARLRQWFEEGIL